MNKRIYVISSLILSILILSFNFTLFSVKTNDYEFDDVINLSSTTNPLIDKDGDSIDDSLEEINKRTIDVGLEANTILVESIRRATDKKDEIRTQISYGSEGVTIQTQYRSSLEADFELTFSISFRRLVEYTDVDYNGIFDPEIDNIIKNYSLEAFSPAVYESHAISSDTDLSNIRIQSIDKNFTLNAYFTEEFTLIENTLLNPVQVKCDIELSHFKFLNSTSSLALSITLEGENLFENLEQTEDELLGFSTNESGLRTSFEGYDGYITWFQNSTVNGKSVKVASSNLEDEESFQEMHLSYLRGETIVHVFKIGIQDLLIFSAGLSPETMVFLIFIIGAVSAIVVYSIYNHRVKKYGKKKDLIGIKRDLIQDHTELEDEMLFDGKMALKMLQEDNAILRLYDKGNINITALTVDFYETVDLLELERKEKTLFIEEMLALTPYEREMIIRDMLML